MLRHPERHVASCPIPLQRPEDIATDEALAQLLALNIERQQGDSNRGPQS